MTILSKKYTAKILAEFIQFKFDNRNYNDLDDAIKSILMDMEHEILFKQNKTFCSKLKNMSNE